MRGTALLKSHLVSIPSGPSGEDELEASLVVPPRARGLVIFAHGSGSGRLSLRHQKVSSPKRRRQQ